MQASFFPERGRARNLLLALAFLAALAVRADGIGEPALEVAPGKQMRSALVARELYYKISEAPTEADRDCDFRA